MIAGFIPHHRRRDPGRRQAGEGARARSRRGVSIVRAVPVANRAGERRVRPEDARRRPKAEREKIAHEYLALAKLTEAAGRYPNELSGGMQQRVGVVRALANEPDVLLMDEPFASVDAQTRMTLQEELTRIWQEKRPTVIFITHDVRGSRVPRQPRGGAVQGTRARRDCRWTCRGRASWDALNEDDTVQGADRARSSTRAVGLSHAGRRPQIAKDAHPDGGRGCLPRPGSCG